MIAPAGQRLVGEAGCFAVTNLCLIRFIRGQKPLKKSLKKSQKKACQPLTHSIKRGIDATNRPEKPFKKTLKKVKKKLVSAVEI
jgi:hypothetical protein